MQPHKLGPSHRLLLGPHVGHRYGCRVSCGCLPSAVETSHAVSLIVPARHFRILLQACRARSSSLIFAEISTRFFGC